MRNRPLRTLLLAGTVSVRVATVPVPPSVAAPATDVAPKHAVGATTDGSGDWLKEWLCAMIPSC